MAPFPFLRESKKTLKSDGDALHDLESRVRALEDKSIIIEVKLDRMIADIRQLVGDLEYLTSVVSKPNDDFRAIKGKLSQMPSAWQMVGIVVMVVALFLSGAGVALAIATFL